MKKIIVTLLLCLFVFSFLITACGADGVTSEMASSISQYADQYDAWYPNADQNVARECLEKPSGVYWSDQLRAYAVTCPLSLNPNSYGIVTLDENKSVLNAFSISAASQGEVTATLATLGWEQ